MLMEHNLSSLVVLGCFHMCGRARKRPEKNANIFCSHGVDLGSPVVYMMDNTKTAGAGIQIIL